MSYLSLSSLISNTITDKSKAIRTIPKLLLCTAIGLTLASCSGTESKTLNLYNWDNYLPQEVIDGFTNKTGITVNYITYDTNEEMYDNITAAANSGKYDLVIPTNYFVDKMIKEDLLQTLDREKITNFNNLDISFTDTVVDAGNKYSIPYVWGNTGLVIDGAVIDSQTVNSWDDLWRPEFKGQIVLMDDMRDVFGMALQTLGYSVNSQNPDEIKAAYNKLTTLMPSVIGFSTDAEIVSFFAGDANLGMTWNGEALIANNEGMSSVLYKYPTEGAILWMESFVIPKDAKNVDAAHQFIDYLLLPENAKIISEEVGYPTPNTEATKMMTYEVKNNPIIYPSKEVIAQGEFLTDVGDEAIQIYQKYWDQLKADFQDKK